MLEVIEQIWNERVTPLGTTVRYDKFKRSICVSRGSTELWLHSYGLRTKLMDNDHFIDWIDSSINQMIKQLEMQRIDTWLELDDTFT